MFTGIVETIGTINEVRSQAPGVRFVVRSKKIAASAVVGESVAVSGCCLTVVAVDGETLQFDAGSETLSRTNLGRLTEGSVVNLEQSLQVGDRMGGHFVTGHIDAVGKLEQRDDDGDWSTFWFRVPSALTRQMASKGSITVDGVSLTLVDVETDRFSVALIPHTLQETTLGRLEGGDPVNLETDILAKYVERQFSNATD